jgi:hypothetical protein
LPGTLIIEAYLSPSPDSEPVQYQISASTITEINNTNYLKFIYYPGSQQTTYAGLSISWVILPASTSGVLTQALTITALSLVSFFCMGCCGVLCRRLYRSSRRHRVFAQRIAQLQLHVRNSETHSDRSLLTENDIERCFPKLEFQENLLEVGEKVCCICFDE